MREEKAFYYKTEYYLFPEGIERVETLYESGATMFFRLRKQGCVPPDFIDGEWEEIFLSIDEPVVCMTVRLYEKEEYESALFRRVKDCCQSCVRFLGDENDLTGHLDELSLSGVCYLKDDGKETPFSEVLRETYAFLEREEDTICRLIDFGDEEGLSRLTKPVLRKIYPNAKVRGGRDENERYCLYFSGGRNDRRYHPVGDALSQMAEGLKRLIVVPYFPVGAYDPEFPFAFEEVYYRFCDDTSNLSLLVKIEGASGWKKAEHKQFQEGLYDELCYLLGEESVGAIEDFLAVENPPEDYQPIAVEEFENFLKGYLQVMFGDLLFPIPCYVDEESEEGCYPYKTDVEKWMTACPDFAPYSPFISEKASGLSARLRQKRGRGQMELEGKGIYYIYLFFPRREEDIKERFLNDFEAVMQEFPFEGNDICTSVGATEGEQGDCIDFMVFHEGAFFHVLRKIAPLLIEGRVKIITIKNFTALVLDGGYDIAPEDTNGYS